MFRKYFIFISTFLVIVVFSLSYVQAKRVGKGTKLSNWLNSYDHLEKIKNKLGSNFEIINVTDTTNEDKKLGHQKTTVFVEVMYWETYISSGILQFVDNQLGSVTLYPIDLPEYPSFLEFLKEKGEVKLDKSTLPSEGGLIRSPRTKILVDANVNGLKGVKRHASWSPKMRILFWDPELIKNPQ